MTTATLETLTIESLWHTYHQAMLRYVRGKMPADEAEDIVQDAFLRALEAMHKGKGYTDHASGWLFRIAHNLVIDRYRARGREPEQIELDATPDGDDADEHHVSAAERIASADPLPHEQVETAMLCEEVSQAMNTLQDEQRQVILLSLQGYEYAAIGELLGKNSNAVKSQYRRGLENVRTRLGVAPVPPSRHRPRQRLALNLAKHGPKPRQPSVAARQVRDLLLDHGPMLPSDIARRLGRHSNNIRKFFAHNRDTFMVVGYGDSRGHRARLWGIRGVHDLEMAAD